MISLVSIFVPKMPKIMFEFWRENSILRSRSEVSYYLISFNFRATNGNFEFWRQNSILATLYFFISINFRA